jgi:phosphocarrier protein HPr
MKKLEKISNNQESVKDNQVEEEYRIKNKLGLHSRPAARLREISESFEADLKIIKGGREVDCRDILDMISLNCTCGTEVTLRSSGPEAIQSLKAAGTLILDKFGEE